MMFRVVIIIAVQGQDDASPLRAAVGAQTHPCSLSFPMQKVAKTILGERSRRCMPMIIRCHNSKMIIRSIEFFFRAFTAKRDGWHGSTPQRSPMPNALHLLLATAAAAAAALSSSSAASGECPLDFNWSNFTLATMACSEQNDHPTCCRYINAFVAVSVALYANSTGLLGVPPAFSESCIVSLSEALQVYGVPPNAAVFCGLGPKIQVSYQCDGRDTVLQMMQSPNFNDVIRGCEGPLSLDTSCKICLNSGITYLHRLIGTDDNVALSVCRNAVFVTLVTQGGFLSSDDMITCFFGVQGLTLSGSSSEPPGPPSPNAVGSDGPTHHSIAELPSRSHHSYQLRVIRAIGIGVMLSAFLLLLVLGVLIHRKHKELKFMNFYENRSGDAISSDNIWACQEGPSSVFRRYSYKETMVATSNFSSVIGKGGFGTVYKAVFNDGSVAAVKRMDRASKQAEEEFCREIELLARLHHRHLVTLKGFCAEKNERFLVYEYMANGSLKDHLHPLGTGRRALTWGTRLQIAIDIAYALEYLHFYCNPPLCHRDIKSSNILLDEKLVAKLADFGLAHASRTGTISFEPVSTDIRGTPGYMDPEYVITQELTEKSDIYSYGVLLLELVSGRKAIQDSKNLVKWSQKFMEDDSKLDDMLDPAIRESADMEQIIMVIKIIKCCTQREGRSRPSIKHVLRMLCESLENMQGRFADEENSYMAMPNSELPHSGDAKCLPSSSSTTKSYCSRSMLLENNSA